MLCSIVLFLNNGTYYLYLYVSGPKAARIYREIRDANIEAGRIPPTTQQVYVLRDGFSHFGNKFKRDPELVEDWDEEAWQFR